MRRSRRRLLQQTQQGKILNPFKSDSKRLDILRRVNPAQKNKTNLQGIYESLPEGATIGQRLRLKLLDNRTRLSVNRTFPLKAKRRREMKQRQQSSHKWTSWRTKKSSSSGYRIINTRSYSRRRGRNSSDEGKLQLRTKIQLRQTWQKCQEFEFLKKKWAVISPKKIKLSSKKRTAHSLDTLQRDHDQVSLTFSIFFQIEKVEKTRKNFRKNRLVVKYGEQSCDSVQGQESTAIKRCIRANPPIQESSIDQT